MDFEKFINELRNDIIRIGNRAVKKAQLNSLKKGVPNVYMLNDKIFFQLPDGEITSKVPEMFKKNKLLIYNQI